MGEKRKKQPVWPDGLSELFEHVTSIPANDELELRVAVHDLQTFAVESSGDYQHIDAAILTSCSNIVRQAAQNLSLRTSEKQLNRFHSKPYIRSINALIRTLLPRLSSPQPGLCFDGLQLQKCELDHIDLSGCSLRMADLSHCRLARTRLHRVDLRYANLMSATLTRANLSESLMESCELDWCDLSHADLHRCQLMKADMGGSILSHADLSQAILSDTNLANATLSHANLSHANLFAARLHFAKLHGSDLTGTGITPERLENAGMETHADRGTIWGSDDDCCKRNPLDPAYYMEQQDLL
ncbi:MAG: pentapeptide repeat-containing protein [Mariprofundaceae bacterium]